MPVLPYHYLIDTHLHLWPGQSAELFLDSLCANLYKNNNSDAYGGILLATQNNPEPWQRISSLQSNEYNIETLSDRILIMDSRKRCLTLFFGSQIKTAEGLEVLSFGDPQPFQRSLPLVETVVQQMQTTNVLCLPWGFGKWLGKRGDLIKNVFQQFPSLWLGDTSLRSSTNPLLLDPRKEASKDAGAPSAARLGTLFGTDPLPFSDQELRAGEFPSLITSHALFTEPIQAILHKSVSCESVGKRHLFFYGVIASLRCILSR